MVPGGLWWSNVLNSNVPPQRLKHDTLLEYLDPVSYTAFGKSEVIVVCGLLIAVASLVAEHRL